jgi:hypothetical protein
MDCMVEEHFKISLLGEFIFILGSDKSANVACKIRSGFELSLARDYCIYHLFIKKNLVSI